MKKVLYISGSVGLGHVTRDLPIARELRRQNPEVEVLWLAEDPATTFLRSEGEKVLPDAANIIHGNKYAPDPEKYVLNVQKWFLKYRKTMGENVRLLLEVIHREKPDLVVGDETLDLMLSISEKPEIKTFPFAMIFDFFGVDAITSSPMDHLSSYLFNKTMVKVMKADPKMIDNSIMIGEVGDVPDKSFGFMLPNRREFLTEHGNFVGYVIRFDPNDYTDKRAVRKKLGFGDEPLIVCTKGGTNCGRPLLDLCANSFPIIREKLPDAKMVIVCGPMTDPKSVPMYPGIEVLGYVPNLYEYIAACDYCITQAGQTTTIEIMSLRKPFAYFPLEEQFDQNITTGGRLKRLGAGIEMRYYQTTPQKLAEIVLDNIGKPVNYESGEFNGAKRAAESLSKMLHRSS